MTLGGLSGSFKGSIGSIRDPYGLYRVQGLKGVRVLGC